MVIICATRAAADLGLLAFKISVLRQKLVICATRAGAILGELVFKISIIRQKIVIIVSICLQVNLISHYFDRRQMISIESTTTPHSFN